MQRPRRVLAQLGLLPFQLYGAKMGSVMIPHDSYVYVHRRKTDGTVFYVGKGQDKRAWSTKNRNPYWHRSVAKYGLVVEIVLDKLQSWYALDLERELCLKYEPDGLVNLTAGGDGILYASEETRKKISSSKKGKKPSQEAIQKRLETMKGYRHSEETRRKISEGQKGNKRGPETAKKIAKAREGYVISEETRKKLSQSLKGRKISDQQIERLKQYWTGRKHRPETIEKMREAQKNRGPVSEETRKKQSEARKGKKRSPDAIEKTASAHRGMKRSEEFRQRMKEIASNRSEETRKKISEANKGKKLSEEQKRKISEAGWIRWEKIRQEKLANQNNNLP